MAQTRLSFFNHGDPEHIADPWVEDQVKLGRLLLARQESQRQQQGLAAELAARRYGQQADARDFQQRQYEFNARLADEAAARREQALRQDRLFEAQRGDANARLGLDREELGVRREAMKLQADDQNLDRQFRERQLGETVRGREEGMKLQQEELAARQRQQSTDRFEDAAREARAFAERGIAREDANLRDLRLADERMADKAEMRRFRNEDREDRQREVAGARAEVETARAEAKNEDQVYRRKIGMADAAARFAEAARKVATSENSDEEKLAMLVAAVEQQIRPPAEAVDVDPATGRKLPVWRPTSKEELDDLQANLMAAALEVFPQFKTNKPLKPTADEKARTDRALGPVGRAATRLPGMGMAADTLTQMTPEFIWRLMGQPERVEPNLGARAVGTAYGKNAGLFKTRSGR